MIARVWRGWTNGENSDHYIALLRDTVLPKLASSSGAFVHAVVLRRGVSPLVEFVVITYWRSRAAAGSVMGGNLDVAYVPADARALLVDFEPEASIFEIVIDLT